MYLEKTNSVSVPAKFFIKPLEQHLWAVIRPMAKNQKYRSSPFAYPFPVSVWNKWSKEKLPEEDDRLNMKRRITYDSGMGNLKPTKVTNTKEEWEYTIPAGRTGIVDQVLAFEKKKKPLGFGAAKLVQPSKRAATVNV